ncbi:hypothetical protein DBA29_17125 [Xenophilus aerolatus]|nr:hypothetical protein [Xenophilus aerolatus]
MFEKTRAIARKYGPKATVAAMTLPFTLASFAQSTDPFDSAVGSITTKVAAYGAALVVLAASAVGFFVAIKYVKKIPRAT